MITTTIKSALQQGTRDLKAVTSTPQLEAELLLMFVLNISRAALWTRLTDKLQAAQVDLFQQLIYRRLQHEPLAYITGRKEFWGLSLRVTPAVLIPRADTEILVNRCLFHLSLNHATNVLELGTGSGAIALAIASERPQSHIIATDKSKEALDLAKENAHSLNISNIAFLQSDWFEMITFNAFDVIVSNPPYIALDDAALEESVKCFEPSTAYYADENGLGDIKTIVTQAPAYLKEKGWLMVEHGYQQGAAVRELFKLAGFSEVTTIPDLSGLERVTEGRKNDAAI